MANARAEGDPLRAIGIGVVVVLVGFQSTVVPAGPYASPLESTRNPTQAVQSDPSQAEELLRQALTADLFLRTRPQLTQPLEHLAQQASAAG